ncbi:dapper homolog 2 [Python bivittatus]|uniref:Dapper homolog 2 n=1 Tax=Python bivittatus TaxID=176946 RepID=A0A9F5J4F5_PYTBI|nr:dapper homolog 2 [Python bivittatus]
MKQQQQQQQQQPRLGRWGRRRISERLQAALAGLQELQVLREKQRALVSGALAMQRPAEGGQAQNKEQRLEATLTALKEQLSRLRRQDVGLKSHLDQLDQQISELKLDVGKTSIEYLDSDSRPSSGFYDLSDGGSCSLSNSCTSVFSESISSSHASLLPSSQLSKTHISIFDYRPKSADETTVHTQFQQQGPHSSDGCQSKACLDVSDTPSRSRPRPVSTGDLERLSMVDAGFPKVTDLKAFPQLCPGGEIQCYCVDPKYQSNLVSKSGNDVYPYPSPLHAVALQSPLFSLAGLPSETESRPLPKKAVPHLTGPSLIKTQPLMELRPGGYINKLLQLTRSKGSHPAEPSEKGPAKNQPLTMLQRLIIIPSPGGVKINSSSSQLEKQGASLPCNKGEGKPPRDMPEGECAKQLETLHCVNIEQTASVTHAESSPAGNDCYPTKPSVWDSPVTEAGESSLERSSSSSQFGVEDSSLSLPNVWVASAKKSHKKSLRAIKPGDHESVPQEELAHTKCVPTESHQVRVRFANSKMKSVKMKRRNSEKMLRPGRQMVYVEKPRGVHQLAAKLPLEWSLSQRQLRGRHLVRRPTFAGESTGRSCSESSLYPVPFGIPQALSRSELYRASANAMYSLEAAYSDPTTKKKQRKWQSTVEISAKTQVSSLSSSLALGPPKLQGRRAGILRTVTMRAESKKCHPLHPGAYAKSESDHSEYSAECASLFHSTIAETSEGEISDYTTNRFGDSESSDSDSEGGSSSSGSSLTLDYGDEIHEHEMVWPTSTGKQAAATQVLAKPLPPVPKLCRIKASKALKKKIRRFQPTSLKVMTMV